MATGIKMQEYREDEVGGYAYAVTAGCAVIDEISGGNPITQNGTVTGKVMHVTTIHYRNRAAQQNVLRIYDGGVAAGNLRREYYVPTSQSGEVVNIRGLRFDNTTTGIWCVASTSTIFVHVGGVLRDN
jgi:hypothetical protein